MKFVKFAAAALTLALGASVAMAQTTPAPVAPKAPVAATPPPAAPVAPKAKGAALKQPKTPEAAACSAEADAQNLHGKPRKTFRAKCIKAKMAAAKKV